MGLWGGGETLEEGQEKGRKEVCGRGGRVGTVVKQVVR